jgi:hypothetical protein
MPSRIDVSTMPQEGSATPDLLARLRKLLERSNEKLTALFDESRLADIRKWARRQFSEGARKRELPVLEETGERVDRLLQRLVKGHDLEQKDGDQIEPDDAGPPGVGQERAALHVQVSKFDIARTEEVAEEARNLPWGYGRTRATAMFVDADRLFTYWEVTDPAIEDARAQLGPGGPGAWPNLRVYDVSGRIFDGTNAHSYFDQKVERTDRQWFFHIGKPGSSAVVELGLKSHEGYFVKIARSGRIDFPRREPSAAGDVEWLTVRPGTGDIAHHATEHWPHWMGFGGSEGPPITVAHWEGGPADGPSWTDGGDRAVALLPGETIARRWDWQVIFPGDWQEFRRTMGWEGPLIRTSWEAGPFFVPVELPSRVEEFHTGDVHITSREGLTHVIYGPWKVMIRGLGARAERRVLGVWEMTRTWTEGPVRLTTTRWAEGRVGHGIDATRPGASEIFAGGASEVLVRGASELRLGGASEVFYLGASEVQLGGASETLYRGASEVRLRGASEIRLGGASEWRFRGASEQILGGASEVMARGASEQRLAGASEMSFARGSEDRLANASGDGETGRYPPPRHPGEGGSGSGKR